MTNYEYLRQAYRLNERIKDKQERLDDLRELSVGAVDYAKDRVQTSVTEGGGLAAQVARIIELENDLKRDIEEMTALKVELNRAVEKVKDVDCALLLAKRYILMRKWEQIAEEMNYSIAQVHRLHRKALKFFVIPER